MRSLRNLRTLQADPLARPHRRGPPSLPSAHLQCPRYPLQGRGREADRPARQAVVAVEAGGLGQIASQRLCLAGEARRQAGREAGPPSHSAASSLSGWTPWHSRRALMTTMVSRQLGVAGMLLN